MREILKKYNDSCIIYQDEGRFYLSVDVGHFVDAMETVEISQLQLEQALVSQLTAEKVFIEIQKEKNKDQNPPTRIEDNPFEI